MKPRIAALLLAATLPIANAQSAIDFVGEWASRNVSLTIVRDGGHFKIVSKNPNGALNGTFGGRLQDVVLRTTAPLCPDIMLSADKRTLYFCGESLERPIRPEGGVVRDARLDATRISCARSQSACVLIAATTESKCRVNDDCAQRIADTLDASGITTDRLTHSVIADGDGGHRGGCIGYRPDLGGTRAGATALQTALRPAGAFTVVDTACNTSGFPYSLLLPAGQRTAVDIRMNDAVARMLAARFLAMSAGCYNAVTHVQRSPLPDSDGAFYIFADSTCSAQGKDARSLVIRARPDPKMTQWDGWTIAAMLSQPDGTFSGSRATEWLAKARGQ